ncbi:MAG: carboxypeptidase regulatory-like domain-containing protein, partial [Planctomycetes bacterium]|nr:carboxypeptidase regulatory-like domain-containing protein [Planctomycetota bacterium]
MNEATVQLAIFDGGLQTAPSGLALQTPTQRILMRTQTDENGDFAFEGLRHGTYRLRVDKNGYRPFDSLPLEVSESAHSPSVSILIEACATLPCLVEDDWGQPLAGVQVHFELVDRVLRSRADFVVRSTSSDDEGNFDLPGATLSERMPCWVKLSRAGFVTTTDSRLKDNAVGPNGRILFRLSTASTITIRFVSVAIQPVGSLRFLLSRLDANFQQEYRTDDQGVTILDDLPRGEEFRIRVLDETWRVRNPGRPEDHRDRIYGFPFEIPRTGNDYLVVNVLPAIEVRGRLVDVDSSTGVANVDLGWACDPRLIPPGPSERCRTAADGSFLLRGIPSTAIKLLLLTPEWAVVDGHRDSASTDDSAFADQLKKLLPPPGVSSPPSFALRVESPRMLDLQLPAAGIHAELLVYVRRMGVLSGQLVDEFGQPVLGARVAADFAGRAWEMSTLEGAGVSQRWSGTSDESGRFRIDCDLARESAAILIRHPDHSPMRHEFSIPPGVTTLELDDIRLIKSAALTFSAREIGGDPVAGLRIVVRPAWGQGFHESGDLRVIHTDLQGRASCRGLPLGPATINALVPEGSLLLPLGGLSSQ